MDFITGDEDTLKNIERIKFGDGKSINLINNLPTGTVKISGALMGNGTLKAETPDVDDADGLGILKYQWLADGIEINGANDQTLLLKSNQVGSVISVKVTYTMPMEQRKL